MKNNLNIFYKVLSTPYPTNPVMFVQKNMDNGEKSFPLIEMRADSTCSDNSDNSEKTLNSGETTEQTLGSNPYSKTNEDDSDSNYDESSENSGSDSQIASPNVSPNGSPCHSPSRFLSDSLRSCSSGTLGRFNEMESERAGESPTKDFGVDVKATSQEIEGYYTGEIDYTQSEVKINNGTIQFSMPFDPEVQYNQEFTHEFADELNHVGLNFAKEFKIYQSTKAMALLEGTNVAGLVLVAYPDATKEEAKLATKWITALFAIDDKVDALTINKIRWDDKYRSTHSSEDYENFSKFQNILRALNEQDDIFDSLDESIELYKFLENLSQQSEPETMFKIFTDTIEPGLVYNSQHISSIANLMSNIKQKAINISHQQIKDFNTQKINALKLIKNEYVDFLDNQSKGNKTFEMSQDLRETVDACDTNHIKAVVNVFEEIVKHINKQEVPDEKKVDSISEFIETFQKYLNSVVKEKEMEKGTVKFTEEGASSVREAACGADHAVRIVSNMRGVVTKKLENYGTFGFTLEQAIRFSNLHIEWVNDVMSYPKEKEEWRSSNLDSTDEFIDVPSFNYLHWAANHIEHTNVADASVSDKNGKFTQSKENLALTYMAQDKIKKLDQMIIDFTNTIDKDYKVIQYQLSQQSPSKKPSGKKKLKKSLQVNEEQLLPNRKELNDLVLHLKGWRNQVLWAIYCTRYNGSTTSTEDSMTQIVNAIRPQMDSINS